MPSMLMETVTEGQDGRSFARKLTKRGGLFIAFSREAPVK